MGPSRVKDLMFTGRLMDGAEAHHAGLIARLVSHVPTAATAPCWRSPTAS